MIFKKAFSNKQDHLQLSLITVGHATVDSTWRGTVQSPDCSRLYYIVRGVAYIHAAGGFSHKKIHSINGILPTASTWEIIAIPAATDVSFPYAAGITMVFNPNGIAKRQTRLTK